MKCASKSQSGVLCTRLYIRQSVGSSAQQLLSSVVTHLTLVWQHRIIPTLHTERTYIREADFGKENHVSQVHHVESVTSQSCVIFSVMHKHLTVEKGNTKKPPLLTTELFFIISKHGVLSDKQTKKKSSHRFKCSTHSYIVQKLGINENEAPLLI